MTQTFFFYDLETSGLDARHARIMQFAGIRTDMDLNQIGDPYNILVRLPDDTLPSPEALLVTGITPQQTHADGITEAEFARLLRDEIFTPGTIAVGFNNIRFDDEFIRHLFWRTFHDPYEWAWKDGRSRWDLLDVVRLTRALRPDGIEWPVVDGKPTNRLELITKLNGIDHFKAHDALSDVEALIAVTKLIRQKQPRLYEYLLSMRDKNQIKQLVNLDNKRPFVYASGRYSGDYHKTTMAFPLTAGKNGNVVVYDLRHDPTPFVDMSAKDLAKKLYAPWEERKKDGFVPLPVKEMQYNRAPAVAPAGVLAQSDGWQRLALDPDGVKKHQDILLQSPHFAENVRSLFESRPEFKKSPHAEAQLYDGFLDTRDRQHVEAIRNAAQNDLVGLSPAFADERLSDLLLRYKARNYPGALSEEEAAQWEAWRSEYVNSQLPAFMKSLQRLVASEKDEARQFILQELQLWAESIVPAADN